MTLNSHEKKLVIFLDCGDTLIDEATEERDEHDVVVRARLIPGAAETVRTLAVRGYRLALVADGLAQSFKNMLTDHGLYDFFEVMIYSECMKVLKPHPRMFKAAAAAMDIDASEFSRLVMVGNNLKRDIRGANAAGIVSIHMNWSPRYAKEPSDALEVPDYVIQEPLELIELVERLNAEAEDEARKP